MSKGGEKDEIEAKLLVNEEKEPMRKGGLSTNPVPPKKHHKVHWNDTKLTQVLEYQPSEASDVDDEDSDACICKIM